MPNYSPSTIATIGDIKMGVRVDRATAALPATTASAIFNVSVGAVLVHMLIGRVTTIVQAQANNTKLTSVPTAGTSVDICAVVDITGLEVGGWLSPIGVFATALTKGNAGALALPDRPFALGVGALKLDCAATNTGSIKWSIWYTPIDDGAYITAA
jgi:hypothetical protein